MKKPREFCQDWGCPSKWTCASAWARSEAYWRFDPDADARERLTLHDGKRKPGHAACEDWQRDVARPWLEGVFDPPNGAGMASPEIPSGFVLHIVETEGSA